MQMHKLNPVEKILPTDFIKVRSNQKAILVSATAGFRVGEVDIYMDDEFEGYYRSDPGDSV